MITCYDIVISPVYTEKGSALMTGNKYVFKVAIKSTKIEIKKAVEEIYKVKVKSVNTVIVPGKKKRVRREVGHTSDWKKAIVTLMEGHTIEMGA